MPEAVKISITAIMAAEEKGEYGMIAGDIVQYVPYAFKEFLNKGL